MSELKSGSVLVHMKNPNIGIKISSLNIGPGSEQCLVYTLHKDGTDWVEDSDFLKIINKQRMIAKYSHLF